MDRASATPYLKKYYAKAISVEPAKKIRFLNEVTKSPFYGNTYVYDLLVADDFGGGPGPMDGDLPEGLNEVPIQGEASTKKYMASVELGADWAKLLDGKSNKNSRAAFLKSSNTYLGRLSKRHLPRIVETELLGPGYGTLAKVVSVTDANTIVVDHPDNFMRGMKLDSWDGIGFGPDAQNMDGKLVADRVGNSITITGHAAVAGDYICRYGVRTGTVYYGNYSLAQFLSDDTTIFGINPATYHEAGGIVIANTNNAPTPFSPEYCDWGLAVHGNTNDEDIDFIMSHPDVLRQWKADGAQQRRFASSKIRMGAKWSDISYDYAEKEIKFHVYKRMPRDVAYGITKSSIKILERYAPKFYDVGGNIIHTIMNTTTGYAKARYHITIEWEFALLVENRFENILWKNLSCSKKAYSQHG